VWCRQMNLEDWIAAEPTGQYARRAGFFYALTDRQTPLVSWGKRRQLPDGV